MREVSASSKPSSGAVATVIKELKPWSPTAPHVWLSGLLFLTAILGSPHVVCESLAAGDMSAGEPVFSSDVWAACLIDPTGGHVVSNVDLRSSFSATLQSVFPPGPKGAFPELF